MNSDNHPPACLLSSELTRKCTLLYIFEFRIKTVCAINVSFSFQNQAYSHAHACAHVYVHITPLLHSLFIIPYGDVFTYLYTLTNMYFNHVWFLLALYIATLGRGI